MPRTPLVLLLALAAAGCDSEAAKPRPGPAAGDAVRVDREVLIATVPEGADVVLSGARVGATPFRMIVRDDTNVVLEKPGYLRQAVLVTEDGGPNVVVRLVADGSGADPREADEEEGPERTRPAAGQAASPASGAPPGDGPGAESEKAQPASSGSRSYDNMADLKRDYRARKIGANEYRHWQSVIRARRAEELERLRRDFAAGEMTRAEYRERANRIRHKYEGR